MNYDLGAWRELQMSKGGRVNKEWNDGFAMMDLDGGAAWDLVTQVHTYDQPRIDVPRQRHFSWGVIKNVDHWSLPLSGYIFL